MATARNPGTLIGGAGSDTHLKLSFEFFPPKTDEMEKQLWQAVKRLEPLAAALRLGDLRRRRLDARAHARDGAAHPQRDDAGAGGAPDLRRRRPRRSRRRGAPVLGRRHPPHRRAARRSCRQGAGRYAPHPGGYALRRRPRRRPQAHRAISRSASRPIPRRIPRRQRPAAISTTSSARSTPAPPARSRSIFFDVDMFLRFRDRARRRRHRRADRARASCR